MSSPTQKAFNSEESRCNICQEEFDTGDEPEIPLTLSCGHVLGSVCLSRWLHVPNRKNGCPLCRRKLFKAREEPEDDLEEGEIEDEEDEGLEGGEIHEVIDEDVDMLLADEEAYWANITHDRYNPRPAVSPTPIEDELSTEMHQIFGDWPSTTIVIEMLRTPTITRNPAQVIESLIGNHLLTSSTPLRRTSSYRALTADLFRRLKAALTATSNWLSTRPAFNAHACSQLHHHLHLSLLDDAAHLRSQDKINLINLLKAGVFTSPRMDASFSLRLIMAEGISTDLLPFGDGANLASAHMYRVLDAMPNLCGVYQEINIAEGRDPSHIAEYRLREVWEADMAPVLQGGRRSWDLMAQTNTPPAVGGEEMAGDTSSISESVNETSAHAESLLGIQPGSTALASEASWRDEAELLGEIGEDAMAEQDTESISRQIDRTLARAHELLRDMDTHEPHGNEGSTTPHGETEPRLGRGGRRGRGRGRQGGSG
ncbi:MAG: hypothetical protein OHK93_003773 [Ramalina farinacea]|uniref:RING-type domain-containing protein n=1 Tax=Ramalina farinacea TaxID=258253 RepID=A0AA43QVW2_9LECA|nr:hypothetical protein [Ramalina farinacea]